MALLWCNSRVIFTQLHISHRRHSLPSDDILTKSHMLDSQSQNCICLNSLISTIYLFIAPYSKDDLAAGLLHIHCLNLAKFSLLNAMLKKVKSVVFCGSFVDPPIARETMEQYFLVDEVMEQFRGVSTESVAYFEGISGATWGSGSPFVKCYISPLTWIYRKYSVWYLKCDIRSGP